MKLSVVIPVYNEEAHVLELLNRVLAVDLEPLGLDREVIVVDDGSSDGTVRLLEDFSRGREEIRLFRHGANRGKGAAIRTGLVEVSGDIVVIQDADLEYNPQEFPKLLAPILKGQADVVFGSRFVTGEPHRVLYFWHSVANKILTLFSNALTDLNLTDMEVCYKLFRREIVRQIELVEDRFGFEPEITAKVARLSRQGLCRIYEVGISYSGRTYAEGKKIGWWDAFGAVRCILKYNLLR